MTGSDHVVVAGVLWLVQFIFACQVMVVSGSVTTWYFSQDKSAMGCSSKQTPILTAVLRLFFFHLGSVAFGSLTIALVQLARIILIYIELKLKGAQNEPVKFLLRCLGCCLWCLEKVLKFLTSQAYIMICKLYRYL